MMLKQKLNIKSSIVDANNYLNRVFLLFDSLNRELHLRQRLIDIFFSFFSFHEANHYFNESKICHCNILNNIMFNVTLEPNIVVIISNASIKNNVATSITHIHLFNSLLKKILHHTINITLTEAELFALRYRIN